METQTKTPGQLAREEVIREMAILEHQRDGEIEIDAEAMVSEADDNGAYVAAWVWVDFSGTALSKCQTCKGPIDDVGEYDEICKGCAEAQEAKRG